MVGIISKCMHVLNGNKNSRAVILLGFTAFNSLIKQMGSEIRWVAVRGNSKAQLRPPGVLFCSNNAPNFSSLSGHFFSNSILTCPGLSLPPPFHSSLWCAHGVAQKKKHNNNILSLLLLISNEPPCNNNEKNYNFIYCIVLTNRSDILYILNLILSIFLLF